MIADWSWKQEKMIEYSEPKNIVIVLDISRSMLAEDIIPNRIESAKNTIHTFLTQRKNDMISLIVFAGKPFLISPFSDDYTWLAEIVKNMTPYFIRQENPGLSGTAIGDALLLANMTLSGVLWEKSIIFITDGRANIGIDPYIALGNGKEYPPIYTIGIGWSGTGFLSYTDDNWNKQFLYDEHGNKITSDIDDILLSTIAKETGWSYTRVTKKENLEHIFDEINKKISITKWKMEAKTYPLTGIFFCIFLIFLTIERIYRKHILRQYHLS
jgi:Ca-activated chloride channel homolog